MRVRGNQNENDLVQALGMALSARCIARWLALLLTVLFCLQVFGAIDRHSHSASDTLYGIFPFWVSAWTILGWIASRTSAKQGS